MDKRGRASDVYGVRNDRENRVVQRPMHLRNSASCCIGKICFSGPVFFLFSKYITFGNISYPSRLFIKISRLFIRDDVDCISSRSNSSGGRVVSFFFLGIWRLKVK